MKLIERPAYIERLKNVEGTPDIKVITGIRRCGKSALLSSFIHHIKKTDENANVVSINLQQLEYESLLEYHALHEYILNHYTEGRNNYLFIDEVQLCNGFEKAINSIHSKNIYDIYITGSNAFLLSNDLATLFTGRTYTIEVYPFSFREFMDYFDYSNPQIAFEPYQKIGGFAGAYVYSKQEDRYNYIQKEVYETIVMRDLMQKYKIQKRNRETLENLTSYLMDNISNLTSAGNITKIFNQSGNNITNKTISKYIQYLTNAFVFYRSARFDLKGKRYLSTESKYYLTDHSIRYACLGTKNADYGRILENIVYMELLRRGYEVYVGKLYRKEVDFVAKKRDEQIYIQVSAFLDDASVMEREVSPLLMIRDGYTKMIIARTHQESYQYEGIKIVDIADWLYKE